MMKRQKMLMVTCFYDPDAADPEAMVAGDGSEEALFAGIEEWLDKGGVVRVSHLEAHLLRPAGDGQWVGVTFVPVVPAAAASMPLVNREAEADAY